MTQDTRQQELIETARILRERGEEFRAALYEKAAEAYAKVATPAKEGQPA